MRLPAFLKYALYSPKANSIIYIILGLIVVPMTPPITRVFILFVVIDCIRDIKIRESFYNYRDAEFAHGRDKLFCRKSLFGTALMLPVAIFTQSAALSILAAMIPRVVFLLVVCPYISFSVLRNIKKKMKAGHPLEHRSDMTVVFNGFNRQKSYYCNKHVYKLFRKGRLISNIYVRESEFNMSWKKYLGPPPKNKIAKFINEISHKERDAMIKATLLGDIPRFTPAYLSAAFYKKYPKRIAEVMLTKGAVSPWKIKEFEELKDLNLTMPLGDNNSWSEPFIIQALEELVKGGIVEDLDLSDVAEINHTYRHVDSKVVMKSVDLNALLDDEL